MSIRVGIGMDTLEAQRKAAEAAASAAVALAAAGPNYPSTAAGLAATANGETFAVDNGDGTITVYLNNAGSAVALRTFIKDPTATTTAALLGWIQEGSDADPRTIEDKARDHLNAYDFGVTMDGVTDDTDAWRVAIVAARLQGKILEAPSGRTVVSDELFDGSIFNGLTDPAFVLRGQGMNATVFVNKCVGVSPFNVGNTYFTELADFKIEGNGLTGASGNGHAVDMTDPDYGTDPFKPGTVYVRRVWVTDHRGNAVRYDGAAMPACGLYAANALNLVFDGLFIQTCTIGAYLFNCYEPKFYNLALDNNYTSGLVDDQNENLGIYSGVLLINDASASSGQITLHDTTTIKAGSYVHYYSRGSNVHNCKFKAHRYAGVSLKGATYPLLQGCWFLFNEDGEYEIYGFNSGIRLIGNTFDLSPPTGGTRSIVKIVLGGGINDLGCIENNLVRWYGGGNVAQIFDIDGSSAAAIRGVIRDNIIGDAVAPGNACVVTDAIRISGSANAVRIINNRVNAPSSVTVTDMIDLSGCSQYPLTIDGNVAATDGGTITNTVNPTQGWAFDPGAIADGDSLDTDQTLTGVALGDIVLPSFSLDLQGLSLTAAVTAANTITFTFTNCTGGSVNLGSGALRAKVFKPF